MKNTLITIIKKVISQGAGSISEINTTSVLSLAQNHDVSQFVYAASNDQKKLSPIIARMMQLNYAAEEIMVALENACIPYIPLKGAVIRNFYPEFWMRTSCDIDILVHENDLDRCVAALKNIDYRVEGKKNYHDISLYSPDGMHLELHFNIKETIEPMDTVLETVWDYAVPDDGYRYVESPEFFLFHHIAHMAYHFHGGGCGIRPFVDLWILEKKLTIDEGVYRKLLRDAGLEKFEEQAFKLMRYWFEDGTVDNLILNMEHYIINGGMYGSAEQSMVIKQDKAGNKVNYFIRRLFMPYESMVIIYPVLKKHKWLLPFMEIHRWGKVVKSKDRIAREIKMAMDSEVDYSVSMMNELGL